MAAFPAIRFMALALLLASSALGGQSPADKPSAFPHKLLEGRDDFALALQFQSDSRGNVGPCG